MNLRASPLGHVRVAKVVKSLVTFCCWWPRPDCRSTGELYAHSGRSLPSFHTVSVGNSSDGLSLEQTNKLKHFQVIVISSVLLVWGNFL